MSQIDANDANPNQAGQNPPPPNPNLQPEEPADAAAQEANAAAQAAAAAAPQQGIPPENPSERVQSPNQSENEQNRRRQEQERNSRERFSRQDQDRWTMKDGSSDDEDFDFGDDLNMASEKQLIKRLQHKLKKVSQLRPEKPPKYDGTSKYSELENWLTTVDLYLKAKNMHTSSKAVDYVATLLSGPAVTWWRYHRIAVSQGMARQITYWDDFQEALLRHFRPEDAERLAREKLQRCTQKTSVRDYNQKFQLLMVELPTMDEKDRKFAYFTGLKHAVRLQVELHYPRTLNDAMELAELSDSTIFRAQQNNRGYRDGESGRSNGKNWHKRDNHQGNRNQNDNNNQWGGRPINSIEHAPGNKEKRNCFYCGNGGHIKANCRKFAADKQAGTVKPNKISSGASAGKDSWKKNGTGAKTTASLN